MEVDSTRPTTDLDRVGMSALRGQFASSGHSLSLDAIERPDTDHDATSLSDERSVAASQTSTLDTAASSQMNPHPDSKESSQSSIDHYDGNGTPMDLDATKANGTRPDVVSSNPTAVAPIEAEAEGSRLVNGGVNGHTSDLKHGQKRTASGAVKRPSDQDPALTKSGLSASHKRNASANTQVNELSAQLRARLSYAMLKVQNGWETRTLDEVEALAAQQQGSPMSVSSPWRNSGSPNIPQISSSTSTLPPPATLYASHALNGSLNADMVSSRPGHNSNHSASISAPYIPPLAPPVDFGATSNPRRSAASGRSPPQLNGNGTNKTNSSSPSMKSSNSVPLIPATPPLQETPLTSLQTPSQRATASERDAIETLLFMSSPGNSQAFRNGTPQVRPLSQGIHQSSQRPTLSASPQRNRPSSAKQVSFLPISTAAAHAMDVVDRVPLSPRKKGILDNANLETDAGIDHVLDQMPIDEGESSSDESLGSVEAPSERPQAPVSV